MNGKLKGQVKLRQFTPASQRQIAELVELKRQKASISWKEAAESLLAELGMPDFDYLSQAHADELIEKFSRET